MTALRSSDTPPLTAAQFLSMDTSAFGDAWRYELVAGRPVAMAPPSPEHGRILGNVVRRLQSALDGVGRPCTVDPGIGVRPANAPGDKVRAPDAVIMYRGMGQDSPVVVIEVMSPSNGGVEYEQWRADLKAVEGVRENVELAQDGPAAQVFRRHEAGWLSFEVLGGDALLRFESLGVAVPMKDFYAGLPSLRTT
jgi:Uma2 family endonuclease